jgi:putative hydrolase of the HAD superfamily
LSLAGIRYVLFDAVGTLIYARPKVAEVYATISQRYGSQLSADVIKQRFAAALERPAENKPINEATERERWRRIVAQVLDDAHDPDGEMFSALWNHFAEARHWQTFEDVAPTWQPIAARRITIGIASNFDARLHTICRELPPLDRCQHLFVSSQIGYAKPDPRFFRAIERQLSAAPSELLLVGDDRGADFDAAQAAGWHALLVDRDAPPSSPGVLRDLRELLSRF